DTAVYNYNVGAQAITNYYAVHPLWANGQVQDTNATTGGVLVSMNASPKGLRMGDLKDGTSKTIVVGEGKGEKYASWFSGQSAYYVITKPDVVTGAVAFQQDGFPCPTGNGIAAGGR